MRAVPLPRAFTATFSNPKSTLFPLSKIMASLEGTRWGLTGFMRLKVGEVGTPYFWKLIQWPESMVEESDSSHSGMVAGNLWWARVGLVGAEAKNGMLKADIDSLAKVSRLKICLGGALVGEEIGGVTGALLDILRGGRDEGMALRRNANGCGGIFPSAAP
nr:Os03g0330900 [Ipomoea batatas]